MKLNNALDLLYEKSKNDLLCNTSYPYKPEFFSSYKSDLDIMKNVKELSLYFHIPFCSSLCRFCEYTKFLLKDSNEEKKYLDLLENQVSEFFENHEIEKLYGLDIGGGTPSVFSENGLERLFEIIRKNTNKIERISDFESSFEFNYKSINEEKIKVIGNSGIKRVSTGIQIYDINEMKNQNRETSKLDFMQKMNEVFKNSGIEKINLDIIYGFPNQNQKMLDSTLEALKILNVEHVTLYEMRFNQNGLESGKVNRDSLFEQYSYLYEQLISFGYKARFGQNTFSKFDDEGVSSYLRYRMRKGISYKGFGISAQSMSQNGISYNSLKGSHEKNLPEIKKICEQNIYCLPKEEVAAKFVSISLYNGCFNFEVLSEIIQTDSKEYYKVEFDYLLSKELIYFEKDFVYLTELGFKYYSVVAAFFWSKSHREKYLSLRFKTMLCGLLHTRQQIL